MGVTRNSVLLVMLCAVVASSAGAVPIKNNSATKTTQTNTADSWRKTVKDQLDQASQIVQKGEVGNARAILEQAKATVKDKASEQELLYADCLALEGRIQVLEGNKGLAEDSFHQALDLKRKLLKPNDKQIFDLIDEYSSLLSDMGRKSDAEKLKEEVAIERAKERLATGQTPVQGKGDAAGKAIEQARELSTKGDPQAFAQWKIALEMVQKQGADDPRSAYCLLKIADCYQQKQNNTEAQEELNKSLEVLKSTGNDKSTCGFTVLRRLAYLAFANKNYQRAAELYSSALEIENKMNCDPRIIASTAQQLASIGMLTRDFAKAESACKQLQSISDQLTGVTKTYAKITATSILGGIYMQSGRTGEGMALMKQISSMQPANAQEYGAQLGKEITDSEKLAEDCILKELQKK